MALCLYQEVMKKIIFIIALAIIGSSGCKKNKDVSPDEPKGTQKDYLTSQNYDKLIIQVLYVKGMAPTTNAINNLVAFLQKYLNKPAGIEVIQTQIESPGKTAFSLAEIRDVEQAHRTVATADQAITAFIFFANGDYAGNAGNSKTLGIAYGFSSMAVFEKTIRDLSGGLGQPSQATVETIVTNHEFGHVLGLVNNGTPLSTAHQDEAHGKHCNNAGCLMYWQAETSDVVANLLNNNVPGLDENCSQDLKSNGGK